MIKYLTQGSVPKGEAGYFASEKKRRLLITVLLFVIPLGVFGVSWYRLGTRNTVWTVGAIVGSLPGCRSLVNLIMLLMRSPMDRSLYERILPHQGRLAMGYELYMTFYDKSAFLDAFAVCGQTVVMLSSPEGRGSGVYRLSRAGTVGKERIPRRCKAADVRKEVPGKTGFDE